MNNETFLCELTALFFRYYVLEPTEAHFEEMFSRFSDQLVMIGTGKHEFFTSLEQVLGNLTDNLAEAATIRFSVLDEWYECRMLTADVYLVYGGIWVRHHDEEEATLIEMDTRFSVVFRKEGDVFKAVHIHHSIPYVDQQYGEYYPKTLSEKTREALSLAKMYEEKSELDLMTEVYNNFSFKRHASERLGMGDEGNFYLFDLDYFKSVNDTYGHAKGDEVLSAFAGILKRRFDKPAMIGRMGGDEFAVFESGRVDRERAVENIVEMQREYCEAAEVILGDEASFSVGIVSWDGGSYEDLFLKVDRALYHAKRLGRRGHFWSTD